MSVFGLHFIGASVSCAAAGSASVAAVSATRDALLIDVFIRLFLKGVVKISCEVNPQRVRGAQLTIGFGLFKKNCKIQPAQLLRLSQLASSKTELR